MYPQYFNDIVGCFEDFEYHVIPDPTAKPVIHAPIKISFKIKEKLKRIKELKIKKMKKMIEPVDEVNPNVIKDKMQQMAKDFSGPKGLKPGHQNWPLPNTNPRGHYTSARRI